MATHELAEELELARKALDAADLSHALHHASGAMGLAPTDEGMLALLDELARAAGDSLAGLVPSEDQLYHGMAALRAWVLRRTGRLDLAAPLLLRAQAAAGEVDYLALLERWLAEAGACGRLTADSFTSALYEVEAASPSSRARLLALAELALGALPDSDSLRFAVCVMHRKEGHVDVAVQLAEAWTAERPGCKAHVALAGALRQRGRSEEAIAQFRAALSYDPADAAVRLDIGDLSMEVGDNRAALEAYEEVLAREPEHPWARPSAMFLRARTPGGDDAGRALLAWARAHPGEERACHLATRLFPYMFALPPRPESMIKVIASAIDRRLTVTRSAVSSFEAPSALFAARAALGDAGVALSVSFGEIPSPDPRDPLGPVPFVAWRFPFRGLFGRLTRRRAIEGEPALPAPPPAHAGAIATLAASAFDRDGWWKRAGGVVDELGLEPARAAALGCLVHPPPCPRTDLWWWDWLFHVQVAAALVLARLASGWDQGPRREALTALLHGPVDWVCTASLVALAEIAEREPEARAGALELLASALDLRALSPVVFMCILEPAVHLLRRLDGLPAALRQRVDRQYDELMQE